MLLLFFVFKSKKRQNFEYSRDYEIDLLKANGQSDIFVLEDEQPTFMKKFKKCIRKKLKEKVYD